MSMTSGIEDRIDGAELIELLGAQCTLYARLGQLAGGQRALITSDRPEQLLGILGERQRLIDEVDVLNERLRPYRRDWRATRAGLDPRQGQRVDELVARVNALLAGILKADAADAELLAVRRSETANNVRRVKAVRQAGLAYGGGEAAAGSRIDWTGE